MIRETRERKLTGKSGLRKKRAQPKGWVFFGKDWLESCDSGPSSKVYKKWIVAICLYNVIREPSPAPPISKLGFD